MRVAQYLLLGIVSGISKEARKYASPNSIEALNYDTKLISMNEVIIHEKQPDSLHKLMTTVSKNLCSSSFTECVTIKILHRVTELVNN